MGEPSDDEDDGEFLLDEEAEEGGPGHHWEEIMPMDDADENAAADSEEMSNHEWNNRNEEEEEEVLTHKPPTHPPTWTQQHLQRPDIRVPKNFQPCKYFFNESASCTYATCPFSHDEKYRQLKHLATDMWDRGMCKFFVSGPERCREGDKCTWRHDAKEAQKKRVAKEETRNQPNSALRGVRNYKRVLRRKLEFEGQRLKELEFEGECLKRWRVGEEDSEL